MEFFKNIKNSIYNPAYYRNLLEKPFSSSLKYYFLFILLASLLATAVMSLIWLPKAKAFLSDLPSQVVQYYPSELEVTIKNGIASTNVAEPYFIKFPGTDKPVDATNHITIENILTIDTKSEAIAGKLFDYKTMVLLAKDSIIYADGSGKITIQPLKEIPDTVINRQAVVQVLDKIASYLKYFYPVVVPAVFIVSYLGLIFKFIYLFFGALFIWLVAKIKNVDIGYGKSYKLGIHLMTLPIIIYSIFPLLGVPLLFTAILTIMAAVNLKPATPVLPASVDPVVPVV